MLRAIQGRVADSSTRSANVEAPSSARRGEALLVAFATVLVYGLTRSGNHSETEDSVSFAVRVREEPLADLLEGTHLVYLPIGRAFAHILSALGLTADPLVALQALDTLLGGAAIGGLWLLLRSAGFTRLGAAAASGIAAFSYAFWRNSIEVEVYALSAAALVASLAAAWAAVYAPRPRSFLLLGAANGVAVLAHVTNVLFAVAAGTALILAARAHARTASAVSWGAAYVGAAALIVVPAYAFAAVVHRLSSPAEFWGWFTERSGQAADFGTVDLSNLTRATFGATRALIGGHSALSLDPILEFATGRFEGKTFSEERYFLAGFSDALAIALLATAVVAGGLVAALAVQWLRRPAGVSRTRVLAILAAAWLLPYALVFLWWDPLNIELWYAVWLPAAVLLAIPVDTLRRERVRAALVFTTIGAIFVVNLVGSVLPQRDQARDLWRAKAEWYRTHTQGEDLVVSNGYVWSSYLRYLLDAEIVDIEDLYREAENDREALRELRRHLASARGRVLVSGEAFHPFAERRSACIDAPRTCAIAATTAGELQNECEPFAVVKHPYERVWRCPRQA